MSLSFRTIVFINVPAAVGMAVLSVPIVRAMYMQGNFTLANMDVTADALVFYCIGLLGYGAQHALNRGFYAIQDTQIACRDKCRRNNFKYSIKYYFTIKVLGYRGLALAYSIAGLVSIAALLWGLNRKVGRLGKRMLISCIKSLVSSSIMGIAVYFTAKGLENIWDMSLKTAQITEVCVAVAVGVAVYAVMAYVLKMEEMHEALKIVRRKVGRAR